MFKSFCGGFWRKKCSECICLNCSCSWGKYDILCFDSYFQFQYYNVHFVFKSNFEKECKNYEDYINDKYKPCLSCRTAVQYHLKQQDNELWALHKERVGEVHVPPKLRKVMKVLVFGYFTLTFFPRYTNFLTPVHVDTHIPSFFPAISAEK